MHDQTPHPDDPTITPTIPLGLARDLHRLDARSQPAWPSDDRVLAVTRVGTTDRATRHGPWRLVGWSAGLAAAAGLAVSAMVWFGGSAPQGPARGERPGLAAAPSSPVTMLDAYRLALMLNRHQTPPPAWDADADGRVTQSDVEALAARAVRVQEASS
ncbi:hypothetical protein MNBD_PLANCTO03-1167 [hydrothermal vent metagenome]|uniref:EF-hand domain-containing protein n=1 Tax=hydrothermal vent metagenome TaxID=652676 RepID=A0A3B1E0X9_9ZZZZ